MILMKRWNNNSHVECSVTEPMRLALDGLVEEKQFFVGGERPVLRVAVSLRVVAVAPDLHHKTQT